MGMITITLNGSFSFSTKQFSAQGKGHAFAIAEAIRWLAEEELPKAIVNDHECHRDGIEPGLGFGGKRILQETKDDTT